MVKIPRPSRAGYPVANGTVRTSSGIRCEFDGSIMDRVAPDPGSLFDFGQRVILFGCQLCGNVGTIE
jgi:hypothetical protein